MEASPSVGEKLAQIAGGEGKETCFTVSALRAGTECTVLANFLDSSAERRGSRLDFGLSFASSLRIPTAFERLIAKARAETGSRGLRTGGGRASLSPETVDYNCITMCNRGSVIPLVPKPLFYLV